MNIKIEIDQQQAIRSIFHYIKNIYCIKEPYFKFIFSYKKSGDNVEIGVISGFIEN